MFVNMNTQNQSPTRLLLEI